MDRVGVGGVEVGGAGVTVGRITLRSARLEDAPLLRHWDEQPHVIASDPNDDWQWETELGQDSPWREQLIAEEDGRPVGFMQIIDPALEESHYWGDVPRNLRAVDIWIGEAADLSRGLGTEMMRQALDRCFADAAVTAVIIDPLASNVRAHRFYERLGFTYVERRRFGDDDCFVYRLDRATWRFRAETGLVVRDYTPALRDACLEIFDSNVPHSFLEAERASFAEFLEQDDKGYVVLWERDLAVACGGWAVNAGTGVADLCWGMVRRSHQGRGIGRRLTELRIQRIREEPDVNDVAMNTSHHTEAFYHRLGFVTTAVTEDGIAPGLHRCDMRLRVRS